MFALLMIISPFISRPMWIQCYRNIVPIRCLFPKSSHIYICIHVFPPPLYPYIINTTLYSLYYECFNMYLQEAKKAFQAVMIIRPRRPVSAEFFILEKEVMASAWTLYNYTWAEGSEVSNISLAMPLSTSVSSESNTLNLPNLAHQSHAYLSSTFGISNLNSALCRRGICDDKTQYKS